MRLIWGLAALAMLAAAACGGDDDVLVSYSTALPGASATPSAAGESTATPVPTKPGRVPPRAGSATPAGSRQLRDTPAVLSTGCNRPVLKGASAGELDESGGTRGYRLYVPAGYNPAKATPLLLNFHGYGEDAAQQEGYSGLVPLADQKGFILVTPEGSGSPQGWNIVGVYNEDGVDDVEFVRHLVAALSGQLCIDQARIFATGHSNGAEMASEIACYLPGMVAAVAPVAGAVYQGCEGRPVAMVAFQGTGDENVLYEWSAEAVEQWAAHNGCTAAPASAKVSAHVTRLAWTKCGGNEVAFYIIDGGGHTWPGAKTAGGAGPTTREIDASQLMWQFFSQHPKRSGQ